MVAIAITARQKWLDDATNKFVYWFATLGRVVSVIESECRA